jgi:hypothetical protein
MPTIRQNVEKILRDHPKSRDDDKILVLGYWKFIEKINMAGTEQEFMRDFMKKATTPESITRARRLIQEDGFYLPSEGTENARAIKEREMKAAIKRGEVV